MVRALRSARWSLAGLWSIRIAKTAALLRAEPNDAPYGVQLFGDDPEIMGQAAALIEGEQFDF